MNRTIAAPKPSGMFWPIMLGNTVPGQDIPLRRERTVNYPDGYAVPKRGGTRYVGKQAQDIFDKIKKRRLMDLDDDMKRKMGLTRDPRSEGDPRDKMMGSMMKALGFPGMRNRKRGMDRGRDRGRDFDEMTGAVMSALGSGEVPFERLAEDLSWRGATQNRPEV